MREPPAERNWITQRSPASTFRKSWRLTKHMWLRFNKYFNFARHMTTPSDPPCPEIFDFPIASEILPLDLTRSLNNFAHLRKRARKVQHLEMHDVLWCAINLLFSERTMQCPSPQAVCNVLPQSECANSCEEALARAKKNLTLTSEQFLENVGVWQHVRLNFSRYLYFARPMAHTIGFVLPWSNLFSYYCSNLSTKLHEIFKKTRAHQLIRARELQRVAAHDVLCRCAMEWSSGRCDLRFYK